MGRWAMALLVVALLAGCAQPAPGGGDGAAGGDEAARLAEADQAAAGVAVEATVSTGIIRGVVVDEAIRPLAGVVVALEGTASNQTTGDTGAFGFEQLAAGTHFLTATSGRHHAVRIGIVVRAGDQDPEPTRIVMSTIPGLEPFVEAFKADLFVAFSAPLFGSLSPSDAGLEGDDRATFGILPNATVIQAEVTWEATTSAGEHIRMYASATEQATPLEIKSAEGGSPLAILLNGTTDGDVADGFYLGVGSLGRSPTSTEPPDPQGLVVLNQGFQGFAHAFHNFRPAEGWLFVRDGEHPLPP